MDDKIILTFIRCPITKLIFSDPVLAYDGYVYENSAIKKHFENSASSPITKNVIDKRLVKVPFLITFIERFLEKYPEYDGEQFVYKKPYYIFKSMFIKFLKNREFSKLTDFSSVELNDKIGTTTIFEELCIGSCSDNIIKLLIDRSIDYDKDYILHNACKYGTKDIILHLLDKDVDINSIDSNGNKAVNYLIDEKDKNEYEDIVKVMIKKDLEINYYNNAGYMLIHSVMSKGDLDTFITFLDLIKDIDNVVLRVKNENLNIFQYSLKYSSNPCIIKYLINKGSYLDVDASNKLTCEQLLYSNNSLNKKDKQEIMFIYLKKLKSIPDIVDNFVD